MENPSFPPNLLQPYSNPIFDGTIDEQPDESLLASYPICIKDSDVYSTILGGGSYQFCCHRGNDCLLGDYFVYEELPIDPDGINEPGHPDNALIPNVQYYEKTISDQEYWRTLVFNPGIGSARNFYVTINEENVSFNLIGNTYNMALVGVYTRVALNFTDVTTSTGLVAVIDTASRDNCQSRNHQIVNISYKASWNQSTYTLSIDWIVAEYTIFTTNHEFPNSLSMGRTSSADATRSAFRVAFNPGVFPQPKLQGLGVSGNGYWNNFNILPLYTQWSTSKHNFGRLTPISPVSPRFWRYELTDDTWSYSGIGTSGVFTQSSQATIDFGIKSFSNVRFDFLIVNEDVGTDSMRYVIDYENLGLEGVYGGSIQRIQNDEPFENVTGFYTYKNASNGNKFYFQGSTVNNGLISFEVDLQLDDVVKNDEDADESFLPSKITVTLNGSSNGGGSVYDVSSSDFGEAGYDQRIGGNFLPRKITVTPNLPTSSTTTFYDPVTWEEVTGYNKYSWLNSVELLRTGFDSFFFKIGKLTQSYIETESIINSNKIEKFEFADVFCEISLNVNTLTTKLYYETEKGYELIFDKSLTISANYGWKEQDVENFVNNLDFGGSISIEMGEY